MYDTTLSYQPVVPFLITLQQVIRVIFRFVFTVPLFILAIDGVQGHHHINESALWTGEFYNAHAPVGSQKFGTRSSCQSRRAWPDHFVLHDSVGMFMISCF